MKRPTSNKHAAGFTIIELLIATTVFSVIMLVITAGILGFTRQYYKGVVTSNTQTTARQVMSELTQAIQFGKSITLDLQDPATGTSGFCVDDKLYSYQIGQQVTDKSPDNTQHQAYHGLVVDNSVTSCSSTTPSLSPLAQLPAGQREMLGDKMRLSALDITDNSDSSFTIHLRIIYGDDDVLNPDPSSGTPAWDTENCEPERTSNQYCAITDLTTKVQTRLQ
ncbi:MAG: prepilin-type N-terminal cleavage/methylation domain-containing protein [Candidatus Saccharimonadales bacterium]